MTHHLFVLLYIVQLAQGASTNAASSSQCPPPNGTTRSVWSILGSCALTLLICVWHTIHFPVPKDEWRASLLFKSLCALSSFFAPEAMVAYASLEWWDARKKVKHFRARGYNWSMTHSFFAEMGGFRYCDDQGQVTAIDSDSFLRLCEEDKIRNPCITVKEIRDKSKSDWLGKAILALQLAWFMLQVIIRGSRGLAITLVELDTVCMGVLSLIVIMLWWYKPLRPECPHVFYSNCKAKEDEPEVPSSDPPSKSTSAADERAKALLNAWKPEPVFPDWLVACFTCTWTHGNKGTGANPPDVRAFSGLFSLSRLFELLLEIDLDDDVVVTLVSLCVTWLILGGLHLIAWDFEFPTGTEKVIWRVASLVLASGSLAFFGVLVIAGAYEIWEWDWPDWAKYVCVAVWPVAGILGVVSRAVLAGLMLASLRALPCSAHQTVSWTVYIPHL